MSRMGVPLTMSAPRTYSTGESGSSSATRSSSTADSPSPLGRKGERGANTPKEEGDRVISLALADPEEKQPEPEEASL